MLNPSRSRRRATSATLLSAAKVTQASAALCAIFLSRTCTAGVGTRLKNVFGALWRTSAFAVTRRCRCAPISPEKETRVFVMFSIKALVLVSKP